MKIPRWQIGVIPLKFQKPVNTQVEIIVLLQLLFCILSSSHSWDRLLLCFVFGVLPACVHGHDVCHGCMEWVEKPEEGAGAPRTGGADGWETPHG